MITAKGSPDEATRHLVHMLAKKLLIPVLCLVDCNPSGFDIGGYNNPSFQYMVYSINCIFLYQLNSAMKYKFGSLSMSYDSLNLTTPSLRLMGLLPSDFTKCQLPASARKPMSTKDHEIVTSLLRQESIASHPDWKNELELMQAGSWKAEISAIYHEQHDFIASYLRWKLVHGDYI